MKKTCDNEECLFVCLFVRSPNKSINLRSMQQGSLCIDTTNIKKDNPNLMTEQRIADAVVRINKTKNLISTAVA